MVPKYEYVIQLRVFSDLGNLDTDKLAAHVVRGVESYQLQARVEECEPRGVIGYYVRKDSQ